MRNSWICKIGLAAIAAVFLTLSAVPTARAARIANGPNFPWGGVGCAQPNGLPPFAPGTQVYLDTTCQYFPSIEWAIGGGWIIASGLSDGKYACLDIAGTSAGATVVVNPCRATAASERWIIRSGSPPNVSETIIQNAKTKLCLDTTSLGPDVIGLVVNPCSGSAGGQLWQIK